MTHLDQPGGSSERLRPAPRRVDVCLCTFRRPGMVATLASLAAQELPDGVSIRVILADNDDGPSAQKAACQAARDLGLDLVYLHAPARNISTARNAALDAATAPWIAFLDDDEEAGPGWLAALMARAEETGADVVLGPVDAILRESAPGWMRTGRFHDTRPVQVEGRIVTGYTCNVLMRMGKGPMKSLRFRPELGRSGGEDTEFFSRAVAHGASIAYAADATMHEPVPPERERLGWLIRRRFRSGQTHGLILAERAQGLTGRLAHAGPAGIKAAFCAAAALATLPQPERRAFWLLRGALHLGVIARLMGRADLQLYAAQTHG
ncbi:MAG: glycosyltransferase family 2 protein [Pseudomonadota bacterium]